VAAIKQTTSSLVKRKLQEAEKELIDP